MGDNTLIIALIAIVAMAQFVSMQMTMKSIGLLRARVRHLEMIDPVWQRSSPTVAPSFNQGEELTEEEKDARACNQCGGTGLNVYGKECFWCEGRGYRL